MKPKLVVVVDSKFARIHEAEGFRIKKLLSKHSVDELGLQHKKQSLRTGFKKRADGSAHFLDPHTEAGIVERCDFSRKISEIVNQVLKEGSFSEIILVAPPKVLNHMKKYIKSPVDMREFAKELIHSNNAEIEKIIF